MTFKKGQSGNPKGRPPKRTEEKYLKRLQSSVTLVEWKDIVKRAVMQAQKGDARARQWLSDYLLGKPIQGIELDQVGEIIFRVEYADDSDNASETA